MDDPQRRPYRREPTGTVHRLSDCGRGVRPRLRYSRSLSERAEPSASVGEPAEGSLKNRPVFLNGFYSQTVYTYLCCFGRPPFRRRLRLTAPARGPKFVCLVMSEYYIIVKTFNNGSLGSGIDEERSEMR